MRRLLLSAGLLIGLSPIAAMAQNLDPVYVYDRTGEGAEWGNGARFQTRDGCITVTPFHVVSSIGSPDLSPSKGAIDNANVELSIERLDIALIKQKHSDPSVCGVLPTIAEIDAALASGETGEIRLVDSGGGLRVVQVDLVEDSKRWDIKVRIRPNEDQTQTAFQPGNSGGMVVFSGIPVGIVTDAFTGFPSAEATAIRMSQVLTQFPDLLVPPAVEGAQSGLSPSASSSRLFGFESGETRPARPTYAPYAIEQLPADFQEVVRQARLTRKKVEEAMRAATSIRQKAEEIARATRSIPEKQIHNGIAWYENRTGDATYRGEAKYENGTLFANGVGTNDMKSIQNVGDKSFCERTTETKGCHGFGVISYAYNDGNSTLLDVYIGHFDRGKRDGYGYLKWKDDRSLVPTEFDAQEVWGKWPRSGEPVVEVWAGVNGRQLEILIAHGKGEGLGVIWAANGQVQTIGLWKDGQIVKNVTQAWRSGTYISGSLD